MDRKTNELQLTEVTRNLKDYKGSTALILFVQLVEYRIDKHRLANDTASELEFLKHQGAIQELLSLLKVLN